MYSSVWSSLEHIDDGVTLYATRRQAGLVHMFPDGVHWWRHVFPAGEEGIVQQECKGNIEEVVAGTVGDRYSQQWTGLQL